MSEAVSVVSETASNEIAVIAGKVFGNILLVAMLVAPLVLLYFVIVNFRKLIIEVRERRELDEAEAKAVEERNKLLSQMGDEQGDEDASQGSDPGQEDSEEDREE